MKNNFTRFSLLILLISSKVLFSQGITLDSSFGTNGKVITQIDSRTINRFDYIQSLAIQPDGKIIACGKSRINVGSSSNSNSILIRYNVDGTIDTTFGTNGIVITLMEAYDPALCLKLLSDGKIIVSGEGKAGSSTDFSIARYNSDGSLDSTFGTNGLVTTDFDGRDDVAYCLEIQSDDKIIVSGTNAINEPNNIDSNFAIARYNYDGTLDNSFGSMGKVSLNFGANLNYSFSKEIANCAKLQSDGKIIVAGYTDATSNYGDKNLALLRLNNDGSLDSGFGINGKVITDLGGKDRIFWIAVTPDDKIIAVGNSNASDSSTSKVVLAKYESNGSLDVTFGINGIVQTQVNNVVKYDFIRYVELQNDGKLLCTGYSRVSSPEYSTDFLLMRYNANGSLDTTFDYDGFVTTNFVNNTDQSAVLAVQANGKVICGGSAYENSQNSSNSNFALVRYNVPNLSANGFLANSGIKVYPNPFLNEINLDFKLNQSENITIDLFDINGRKIINLIKNKEYQLGDNYQKIELPETLSKGIYFLNISNGTDISNIKIVK